MPRPRRKRQSLDSAEGTDKNLDSSYEDRLEPLLSAFARAQAQSNRELIESILNSHTLNQSSTSPTSPGMSSMVQTGNFANCTARFNGSKQDSEVVEAFVDAICVYKECTNISDDHALRGLPMLLEGEAAVWFRGVKSSIASWDDALKRLRSMYGAPRPPHKIFRDIFASDQRSERAEVFVTRLRALMAKLPYTIEERIQLDMIYGLLNNIIRERVSRESVHSIEDLISKARHIEDTINEAPAYPSTVGTLRGFHVYQKKTLPSFAARGFAAPALNTSVPPPALCSAPPPTLTAAAPSPALCASVPPPPAVASVRSAGNASNAPLLTATSTSDDTTKVVRLSSSAGKLFCVYCRKSGHSRDLCPKIKSKSEVSGSQISCYGCGRIGVIRSNCVKCNSFASINVLQNSNSGCKCSSDVSICNRLNHDSVYVRNVTKDKMCKRNLKKCKVQGHLSSRPESKLKRMPTASKANDFESSICDNIPTREFLPLEDKLPFNGYSNNVSKNDVVPTYACLPMSGTVLRTGRPTESRVSDSSKGRPILYIEICGNTGTGLVDTAAKRCIAGASLYALFQRLNLPFRDSVMSVKLADGVVQTLDVKLVHVKVRLDRTDVVIPTTFVIFPHAVNNETLLGVDFLRKARITINMHRDTWFTADRPHVTHRLHCESFRSLMGCASADFLRADEGTMLEPDERTTLAEVLQEYEDVFKEGGGPTPFAEHRIETGDHPPIAVPPYRLTPAKRIKAIVDMKEPTSVKHLKSFLQTCSWFRKFVPEFSKVAQPLTMLTKKAQSWIWGDAQVNAFTELKRLLTSTPILAQPDYSLPFVIRTDASNYALGAALIQGESSREEKPIEYASRLLTPAERNYSTTEREALAVVWACEKFRGYIDGHPVRVASDHQPLKWLLTLKSPTGRLVRWAMKLQSFDLQVDYTPGKANVIADTLSRPPCEEDTRESCGVCTVIVEVPRWDATNVRQSQLDDPEVSKILKDLEGKDEVALKTWTERGYHLVRGVLYRYIEADTEEPQLVVPESLRKQVMLECHDSPTSGHGGIERTLHRIAERFYFPGMRRYVTEYLKTCVECQRYKPSNVKPAGLLQTPVPAQRFEVVAVDLFGPLPKGPLGERWILIVEDTTSKWVELFALTEATAMICAKTLVNEVFMRFGLPRRMISDNGVQFVADVMQHAMFVLGVKQNLIPLYHPEANPVERKNRDLKVQLAILVEKEHRQWAEALPFIRFALNTSLTQATKQTPAFLTFARELRSPISVQSDLRAIVETENYVPQITPYLLKLAGILSDVKESIENEQDKRKRVKDKTRQNAEGYVPGDLVLLRGHILSSTSKGFSSNLAPRQDGPYVITKKVSPTTYILSRCGRPDEILGKYHTRDLRRYHARQDDQPEPVCPKRPRGRPRKNPVA
ncbi:uncharacterized protein [Epargyreus clarus]|uniref:uncharacterized protein n=1 Tax=Epargyreus clarus TaxID=520877 RepID=UPI003C2C1300